MIKIGGDESAYLSRDDTDVNFIKKRINSDISIHLSQFGIDLVRSSNNNIVIIDDLCDGGKTFIEEAMYLRKLVPDRKLYLFVYHALFTKGVDIVAEHFDHIYCTNSYQDIDHPKVTQAKVI